MKKQQLAVSLGDPGTRCWVADQRGKKKKKMFWQGTASTSERLDTDTPPTHDTTVGEVTAIKSLHGITLKDPVLNTFPSFGPAEQPGAARPCFSPLLAACCQNQSASCGSLSFAGPWTNVEMWPRGFLWRWNKTRARYQFPLWHHRRLKRHRTIENLTEHGALNVHMPEVRRSKAQFFFFPLFFFRKKKPAVVLLVRLYCFHLLPLYYTCLNFS